MRGDQAHSSSPGADNARRHAAGPFRLPAGVVVDLRPGPARREEMEAPEMAAGGGGGGGVRAWRGAVVAGVARGCGTCGGDGGAGGGGVGLGGRVVAAVDGPDRIARRRRAGDVSRDAAEHVTRDSVLQRGQRAYRPRVTQPCLVNVTSRGRDRHVAVT